MTEIERTIERLKEHQRQESKWSGGWLHLIYTAICIVTLFTFPPGVIVILIAIALMEDR